MSKGNFFGETLYSALVIILNRFTAPASCFEVRPLTCLVKAEIVSPYHRILINAGLGNPTMPFARPLGYRQDLRLMKGGGA